MKEELTRLSEHIGLAPSRFLQEQSPPDSQPAADMAVMAKLSARVDGVEAAFREYIQDSELESQQIANREAIYRLSADVEALKSAQKGDSAMVRALRALQKLMSQPDPGAFAVLNGYRQQRQADKAATIGLTDGLVTVFSNHHWPMVVGRNLGLLAMEYCDAMAGQFVRQTTGFGPATRPFQN